MRGTRRKLWAGAMLLAFANCFTVYAQQGEHAPTAARALADPAAWVDQVLRQVIRPTLAEVIPVLKDCRDCREILNRRSPNSIFENPQSRDYSTIIKESGPKLVAFLESLYPNGTFAPLGRDTLIISDLLEAFYLTQNLKPVPVVRLGASVATVTELFDRERALEFLISNGLNLERAARGEHPYVLIDRTHYSARSQTVKFMRAVLTSTSDLDLRAQLSRFVNVVGTHMGQQMTFQAGEVERVHSARKDPANYVHAEILLPFLIQAPGCEALTDVERVSWHAQYSGSIIQLEDGRLSGTPGSQSSVDDRLSTLRYMWELYEIVRRPEFLTTAATWADHLGVDLKKQIEGRRQQQCQTNLIVDSGAA